TTLEIPDLLISSNLEVLDLSNNNLTSITPHIDQLKKLKEIKLSGNKQLNELTPYIFKLPELKELNLPAFGLTTLEIPDLLTSSNLEVLDLSNNNLASITANIDRLKKLKEINLSKNILTFLSLYIS